MEQRQRGACTHMMKRAKVKYNEQEIDATVGRGQGVFWPARRKVLIQFQLFSIEFEFTKWSSMQTSNGLIQSPPTQTFYISALALNLEGNQINAQHFLLRAHKGISVEWKTFNHRDIFRISLLRRIKIFTQNKPFCFSIEIVWTAFSHGNNFYISY